MWPVGIVVTCYAPQTWSVPLEREQKTAERSKPMRTRSRNKKTHPQAAENRQHRGEDSQHQVLRKGPGVQDNGESTHQWTPHPDKTTLLSKRAPETFCSLQLCADVPDPPPQATSPALPSPPALHHAPGAPAGRDLLILLQGLCPHPSGPGHTHLQPDATPGRCHSPPCDLSDLRFSPLPSNTGPVPSAVEPRELVLLEHQPAKYRRTRRAVLVPSSQAQGAIWPPQGACGNVCRHSRLSQLGECANGTQRL